MVTIDNAWFSKLQYAKITKMRFYIKPNIFEDSILLNLKNEIETFFQAKLVTVESEANVVFVLDKSIYPGYLVKKMNQEKVIILAAETVSLLQGFYYYLLNLINNDFNEVRQTPNQAIRMIDHWDNFDGTIERGYAGRSIFYENNQFLDDYNRVKMYARMLASVGINYIALNNVNVHHEETFLISAKHLAKVKFLADIFGKFGIKVMLSVNFASPIRFGDLKTADPLDEQVQQWWQTRANLIYDLIPDFGGFLVKADSEGEPGPFAYGRDHAQGANMLARALAPHHGIVIWRTFVYNAHQDWRDRTTDRARAAYDNFMALDGKFDDNVTLQIKFGPIDFQTREPVQPLFGALEKTNQIIEFQVTQEYTGHQIDINYLLQQWYEVLHFDTKHGQPELLLKDVPQTKSPVPRNSGVAAVGNVGRDDNWTGNKLAQANLYGFGRIAWDADLTPEQILSEWLQLTFGKLEHLDVIKEIMLSSNATYEAYTAPLGVGFMVTPQNHYGPSIDGYEFDRWGTYHFADRNGLGVDRTVKTGTGYTRQYADANYAKYEDLTTCPDELLLFFHHVDYTHVLHDGKTVIQHIYDTHFEGVEKVKQYLALWPQLEDELAPIDYQNVLEHLNRQLKNAVEWRDQMNTFFYRMSGIPDNQERKIYA